VNNAFPGGDQGQTPGASVAVAKSDPLAQSLSAPMSSAPQEKLDEVEDIDFLLEEIENKIAPLALA
jgi:hypothetical protein